MIPETVLDVYQLFIKSPDVHSNVRFRDNLRTTLRRYILPSYGFNKDELRKDLEGCLARLYLHQFRDAEAKFKEALEQQCEAISDGSVRNYRSAFSRFIKWLQQQNWYGSLSVQREITSPGSLAPSLQNGTTIAKSLAVQKEANETFEFIDPQDVNRYGLREKDFPLPIAAQLDHLAHFWTDPDVLARKGPAMPLSKFKVIKQGIQCFLGWLKNKESEAHETLSLEYFADLEHLKAFITWGKSEHNKNDNWAIDVAKVALVVTKGLNPQSKWHDFGDLSEVKKLRKYIRDLEIEAREDLKPYAFSKVTNFPDPLYRQYKQFRNFCLEKEVPERKTPPISERTFKTYTQSLCFFFGWLHNTEGFEKESLHLAQIADLDLVKKFVAWGINVRGNGYGWATNIGYAALSVAKWLNPQSHRKHFSDIEQVEEIRDYLRYLRDQNRHEESRQNLDEKRLSFYEAQQVVEYLKQCCNLRDKYKGLRSTSAVRKSWQRYLLIAILTYCPVRQRELRELELGKTLFREADGYWVKLTQEQHKAGKKSGKGREYPLPKHLTADLDEWIQTWRPQVNTSHNLVFICLGSNRCPETLGRPLTENDVSDLVKNAVYKATSILFEKPRKTTPHVFRRIAITNHRRHGRPEQKEALAELMGHSVAEADKTYNEESLREKSQKAENWWDVSPSPKKNVPSPTEQQPQNWIEEDDIGLQHLGTSSYSNEPLRRLRDQAVLVIWALQELNWAQIHRLNVGDLVEQNGGYALSFLNRNQPKTIFLKRGIAEIIKRYLEARQEFGETLTEESPLFIGIGNRSGGGRLIPWSIRFLVNQYLGPVGKLQPEHEASAEDSTSQKTTETFIEEKKNQAPPNGAKKEKTPTQRNSRKKTSDGQLSLFDL